MRRPSFLERFDWANFSVLPENIYKLEGVLGSIVDLPHSEVYDSEVH